MAWFTLITVIGSVAWFLIVYFAENLTRKTRMNLSVKVISQRPPAGRCTLYAAYAQALAEALGASTEIVFSAHRNAHGNGYPALWLNGRALQPADGVILTPTDLLTALNMAENTALTEALEQPLARMLEMVQ